jgi:predicted O-methyltransferase YrrM
LDKAISLVIADLERQSNLQRGGEVEFPPEGEMLAITYDTGMFFSILIQSIKATRILEIGTSSGFSTLWLADAMLSVMKRKTQRPSIFTIEENPTKARWAAANFRKAGVDKMIKIIPGQALPALRGLCRSKAVFDFAFIDADKENMIEYFDLALPMIRVGGVIAADNILYPEHFRRHTAKYVHHVRHKRNVQSVTVPIGMGEEISIKLSR